MFYQIFFSPQVKRYKIISYKHDIYHGAERFKTLDLRKWGNIGSKKLAKNSWITEIKRLP